MLRYDPTLNELMIYEARLKNLHDWEEITHSPQMEIKSIKDIKNIPNIQNKMTFICKENVFQGLQTLNKIHFIIFGDGKYYAFYNNGFIKEWRDITTNLHD
jgi:hypothetical protein